uniref:Uncharacterized protein n=1 Tax=Siphoviridae sp. ctsxw88 TaxID=2825701 RepID=A0A8S5PHA9_9CAUD|nr:MAG TPA: hypothetical protein [Siphoviridae sp. ctsxw88]
MIKCEVKESIVTSKIGGKLVELLAELTMLNITLISEMANGNVELAQAIRDVTVSNLQDDNILFKPPVKSKERK